MKIKSVGVPFSMDKGNGEETINPLSQKNGVKLEAKEGTSTAESSLPETTVQNVQKIRRAWELSLPFNWISGQIWMTKSLLKHGN